MNIVRLLMLLTIASVLQARAGEPTASGDPYLNEEALSRGWKEYPGEIAAGWRLTLRLPTNEFKLGRSIPAKVVYHNVSTNQLRLYMTLPGIPDMFITHVLDTTKKELPMTRDAHEHLVDRQSLLARFRMVAPGARIAFPLQVDPLYAFQAPKEYDLHVTAQGPLLGETSLSTGVARIRIVPENATGTNHFAPIDKH
jgi:hypothetical protein